jgi:hypothetical protein
MKRRRNDWILIIIFVILCSVIYIGVCNQINDEGFTPLIRRNYNSNVRFMRNSVYSSYKQAVNKASKALKFLRLY